MEPLFNLFAQFREYRREDQQPLFPHDQLKRDHNRAVRFTEQWGLKHRLAKEELEFCMDPEKRIRARSRRICGATAVEKNASKNLENYQELKQTTERALRAWEHTHNRPPHFGKYPSWHRCYVMATAKTPVPPTYHSPSSRNLPPFPGDSSPVGSSYRVSGGVSSRERGMVAASGGASRA